MKTYKHIILGLVFSLALAAPAMAASKHIAYRAEVDATKGTSAVVVGKHANKFCAEKMQRTTLGGTVLPAAGERDQMPKNSR